MVLVYKYYGFFKCISNLFWTIPDARFPSTLPAIDGSALTGIAVTDNIRTNTNATFLQNVNVSGTTTATTFIGNLTGNVTGNVFWHIWINHR